jgi:hypothetical protein
MFLDVHADRWRRVLRVAAAACRCWRLCYRAVARGICLSWHVQMALLHMALTLVLPCCRCCAIKPPQDPKACTIVLRGASKDVLNEVERNLHVSWLAGRLIVCSLDAVEGVWLKGAGWSERRACS